MCFPLYFLKGARAAMSARGEKKKEKPHSGPTKWKLTSAQSRARKTRRGAPTVCNSKEKQATRTALLAAATLHKKCPRRTRLSRRPGRCAEVVDVGKCILCYEEIVMRISQVENERFGAKSAFPEKWRVRCKGSPMPLRPLGGASPLRMDACRSAPNSKKTQR